jgi:hypothetical protein
VTARRAAWWIVVFGAFVGWLLWIDAAEPFFVPAELLALLGAVVAGLLIARWAALLVPPAAALALWLYAAAAGDGFGDSSASEIFWALLLAGLIADVAMALGIAVSRLAGRARTTAR